MHFLLRFVLSIVVTYNSLPETFHLVLKPFALEAAAKNARLRVGVSCGVDEPNDSTVYVARRNELAESSAK